jgi:hypothetical protein
MPQLGTVSNKPPNHSGDTSTQVAAAEVATRGRMHSLIASCGGLVPEPEREIHHSAICVCTAACNSSTPSSGWVFSTLDLRN